MKTQNTSLTFSKNSIINLNDEQLIEIGGGSDVITFTIAIYITIRDYY